MSNDRWQREAAENIAHLKLFKKYFYKRENRFYRQYTYIKADFYHGYYHESEYEYHMLCWLDEYKGYIDNLYQCIIKAFRLIYPYDKNKAKYDESRYKHEGGYVFRKGLNFLADEKLLTSKECESLIPLPKERNEAVHDLHFKFINHFANNKNTFYKLLEISNDKLKEEYNRYERYIGKYEEEMFGFIDDVNKHYNNCREGIITLYVTNAG